MNLQSIMWPKVGVCTCQELYFRLNEKVYLMDQKTMLFGNHGVAWFDTYFNGISIGKWRKYTKVQQVGIKLILQGEFKITLYQKIKTHHIITEQALKEEQVILKERGEIQLQFPETLKGMLFFRLEGLKACSTFYGGEYTVSLAEKERKPVKIGIVICTFKREEFIKKNIEILKQYLLENSESEIVNQLEVFISDNGKTLLKEELETERIHIFSNKNVGGSGGFTRGLIEVLKQNQQGKGITHILLMDDDIVIAPESIMKTWQITSLIKEEYREAFIGGAMLRLDQPSIQVEAGASWNGGKLISLKSGLDLRYVESCLYNEVEEFVEFHAWWYCCVPIEIVREDNLPLPLFIRGDDVEYGLRNMKQLILMNGICVWHEPFEHKYSSFLNYYIIRNQLIDNSFHCSQYGKKELKKEVFRRVTEEVFFYRYRNVDLILRGVEDFLKGPEWLLCTDGEMLHKEIMAMGYRAEPIEKLAMPFYYPEYDKSMNQKESKLERIIRRLRFNGYFERAKEERIVSMVNPRFCNVWKAKRVMYYDAATEKGFVCKKSIKEIIKVYQKMFVCIRKIEKMYSIRKREFLEVGKVFRTKSFWEKYLKEN